MGFNIVALQGRVVADPVIYEGSSEKGNYIYARFKLAVKRDYKEQDGSRKTDFRICEAIGQTAKFIKEYYHKGDLIVVFGAWLTKEYLKEGEKRYYDYLSVERTYPSCLRGNEKPIVENLADTRKQAEATQISDDIEGTFDAMDMPPLPEEYHHIFR